MEFDMESNYIVYTFFIVISFGHMIPYTYSMETKQFIHDFIHSNLSVYIINLPHTLSVLSIIYSKKGY